MQIARVIGDLTATQKHPCYTGKKILLVQPLNLDGSAKGNAVVAVDAVNAGIGDRVLLAQDGFTAFTSVGLGPAPIDSAVVGIVDVVELAGPASVESAVPPRAQPAPAKKKHNQQDSH